MVLYIIVHRYVEFLRKHELTRNNWNKPSLVSLKNRTFEGQLQLKAINVLV